MNWQRCTGQKQEIGLWEENSVLTAIITLGQAARRMKYMTTGYPFSVNAGWNRNLKRLFTILGQGSGKR